MKAIDLLRTPKKRAMLCVVHISGPARPLRFHAMGDGYDRMPAELKDYVGREVYGELNYQLILDKVITTRAFTDYGGLTGEPYGGLELICTALGHRLAETILGDMPCHLTESEEQYRYRLRQIKQMVSP